MTPPEPAPTAGYATDAGSRDPAGATWTPAATNFSVYCREALAVELLLYAPDAPAAAAPLQVITLDPRRNRSFHFWHVAVRNLPVGTAYTWRITRQASAGNAPPEPASHATPGGGADPHANVPRHLGAAPLELLDPWARAVVDVGWNRLARVADPAAPLGLRGLVVGAERATLAAPRGDLAGAVIYELHVGGFTRHPSAGVAHPGSFAALAEKIPYLKALGITHVQLLPVAAFDPQDVPPTVAALGLTNFWGYSPHSFAAPHPGYCVNPARPGQPAEFRTLVDALHAAGIGVILDVVFNHTAEGGSTGPVINHKGLAPWFYLKDGQRYLDYTGCGNTINCNHPLVTRLIVETLERWVTEYGIDGFRFDLASVFTRGTDGEPMAEPPLPWAIEFSPLLAGRALIAEAWDAVGLYHVGSFPGVAWSEWNGRYRDVLRRAVRGDAGQLGALATALAGSSDLYEPAGRTPYSSVNFVTCHDGFTLNDLVSYADKHNAANGEDNRDGSPDNLSANHGAEGHTSDLEIRARRERQARNFLALLFLSQGVPMLLAGDEVLRSQQGNNNAWCQDNALGWFDWQRGDQHSAFLRYTRELIAFRRRHPTLWRRRFLTGQPERAGEAPDIAWHGLKLGAPPWGDAAAEAAGVLAFTLAAAADGEEDLHVMVNLGTGLQRLPLPDLRGRRWFRALDTAAAAPDDIHTRPTQLAVGGATVDVAAGSVVVLEAR